MVCSAVLCCALRCCCCCTLLDLPHYGTVRYHGRRRPATCPIPSLSTSALHVPVQYSTSLLSALPSRSSPHAHRTRPRSTSTTRPRGLSLTLSNYYPPPTSTSTKSRRLPLQSVTRHTASPRTLSRLCTLATTSTGTPRPNTALTSSHRQNFGISLHSR